MGLEVKIKYHKGAHKLTAYGDWTDLAVSGDVHLKAGEFKVLPFNISMELPQGYEANIVPRSSTFKKWKILQTNSFAVIDNAYCGDDDLWGYPVYATEDVMIPDGTRIAQFRLNKTQPAIAFTEVDHLGNQTRGGFGSSGEKAGE